MTTRTTAGSRPLSANSAAKGQQHTTPVGSVFDVQNLGFRYAGAPHPALAGIDFSVEPGTFHGIIGPNGSGKSTLLKLLLGTLTPASGQIRYGGRPLRSWSRRELARGIGVVPQREEIAFPLSVRELVSMGRYPHLRTWQRESAADHRAIDAAMQRCAVLDLAGRPLTTLSGGELQRARIARALAQEPATLVLDEPTASLDIRHEMAIFELIAKLAAEGATVVIVTHNLNLAARYADQLLLLDRGRTARVGAPAQVLARETIESVYGWPVALTTHPGPGPDTGAPQVLPLALPTPAAGPAATPEVVPTAGPATAMDRASEGSAPRATEEVAETMKTAKTAEIANLLTKPIITERS